MKNKVFIILLIVIFFIIGIFCGGFYKGLKKDEGDTYAKGWEAAQERLAKSGYFEINESGKNVNQIKGNIERKKDNQLWVKIKSLEILSSESLDVRVVSMNSNTKIVVRKKKSVERYNNELEKYFKENSEYAGLPDSPGRPSVFFDEAVLKDSIRIGQRIQIKAADNIFREKTFIAEEIIILN